jgi:hypothetical protein
LPYTKQDAYTRSRSPRELSAIVLENEVLTATFLPGYGGRLWSLTHRPSGRELLHRNPILQPANLALRDAWLAGGVEWNLGATGHWPLTCEPLHAVRVSAADGTPVLRMFEFERMRRLVLRIDTWLPAGSPVLYVHVSIHNPSTAHTPVYWWSNIAVPEDPKVRVVGPAEHAFHFDYSSDLARVPFPEFGELDRSYPGRLPRAADYFLDIPHGQNPWIAALDENGTGLVQTSTGMQRGRKLFHWGTSVGGRRWQEWLSGPGQGYFEIQAGLARTQLEHLPMPGGATWEWVEAYGMVQADPNAVHGTWDQARAAVSAALEALVTPSALDSALRSVTGFGQPEDVLADGSGWGALEIEAGAMPPMAATPFPTGLDVQRPWRELLASGRLPICDPPAAPMIGTPWRELLEASAADWHAHYHLGLMRLADGDDDGARDAFKVSLDEHPTAFAMRALAFLAPSVEESADLMAEAHRMLPDLRELTIEVLQTLLAADRAADARDLIECLPVVDRSHGRIRLAEAYTALALGDHDRVRHLLAEGIHVDNLREGEDSLDKLWLGVHPGRPVPAHYDFRVSAG